MSKSAAFTKWLCEAESPSPSLLTGPRRESSSPSGRSSGADPDTAKPKNGQLKPTLELTLRFIDRFLDGGSSSFVTSARECLEFAIQDPLLEAVDPADVLAKVSGFIQQAQGLAKEVPEFSEAVAIPLDDALTALDEAAKKMGTSSSPKKGSPDAAAGFQESSRWRM